MISDHGDLDFYLLNRDGEIMVHRRGATGKNYQYPIGEDFYEF